MSSVKSAVEVLKKAQELDRELYLTQHQLRAAPEERAKLKQDLESEKTRLHDLEAALKKLQLSQKEKEGHLAEKEAHIRKLDGQLGQVKTNREYSALQQEIASLKADNSLLEEEIIRVLDAVEAAQEEVKNEKTHLAQVEKEYLAREHQLTQKEKSLAEAAARLKSQRQELMAQVPPEARNLYDLIVQKKQGLGLVKVNGESCGACQLQLRPQLLNEIRLGESLIVCENCSRILYFEE